MKENPSNPGIMLKRRYNDFWQWFQKNQQTFFKVVKNQKNIERDFFQKLASKLESITDGFFFLTGMQNEDTAELIFTADGNIKNIIFAEELVKAAPEIQSWKFTALKPPLEAENIHIEMGGHSFNKDNMFFFSNNNDQYPDEISITIIHEDYTEENKKQISTGIFIFLDNYLGELDFAENIDRVVISPKEETKKDLIPISKLKEFLTWREKEFIEKYDDVYYDAGKVKQTVLEAESESGNKLIAILNTQILDWDNKASHPWLAVMTTKFDGGENRGLPGDAVYDQLDSIEEATGKQLSDHEGYIYIGRQIGDNEQNMYFACKDFRKPSQVFFDTQQRFANKLEIEYDIYKDKYWKSLDIFKTH
jgi:hypothetical protein